MKSETLSQEAASEGESVSHEAQEWLDKIKTREKFFHDGWWKHAEQATVLFNNEKEDKANPYNILYSNTEVLKPSLYSATPKPDVRGRFVETPVSPLTKLVENFLIVFSDPANPGEESFDDSMSNAVTSALVAGMGFIRLRHYPDKPVPLCTEAGHYKGLIWPAGRKWSKLPWIAFRHELTKHELFSQFNIKEAEQAKFKVEDDSDTSDSEDSTKDASRHSTVVYELWVKESREILYLCADWEPILLKEEPDPLGLQSFYPTPGLLLMTHKASRLIPTPLYQYYRNQAEELNRVTARLNRVLAAIKVRGAYNSLLGAEMQQILSDESMENALVPAKEAGLLAQQGGFERQIWLLPIEKLIQVATELYTARQQIKQVIYEITGLSDIIRGSSIASETATAQNLKNKWGSIRLRDMQKSVAGYVRDIYRLTVDAAAAKVPAKDWKAITKAPFPTMEEKAIAQAQATFDQMQGRQPQPQILQTLQSPTIEDLLKEIASDANRTYTINVQSDSTIDLDTATDKAEVNEFMNAMGQLLAGLQPLAALGPSGLEAGKAILIAVCSRFKFGLSILDSIKALQAPPPAQNGPSPEQEKKEKELAAQEKQLQVLLTQIEDGKRDIETQRKEFAADVKVFKAEQQAQERIAAANQQVQQASQTAKAAEEKATFVERKSELSAVSSGLKANAAANQKVQDKATPVLQTMAQTIVEMQKAIADLQKAATAKKRVTVGGKVYESEIVTK